jgi:hypothetical protein
MISEKKIAAVTGIVGGIVAACAGLTPAYAAAGPGACTRNLMGDLTCTQRIKGQVPEGGALPHQETCKPVQPVLLPAFLGQGQERLGPTVTCSPETVGVAPPEAAEQTAPAQRVPDQDTADDSALGPLGRLLPIDPT